MSSVDTFDADPFRQCVFEENKEACRELIDGFWDRHYLRELGLLGAPKPTPSIPIPQPQPDPSPTTSNSRTGNLVERLWVHEQILADLIETADGEPNPQPGIWAELLDRSNRLNGARKLRAKLTRRYPFSLIDGEDTNAEFANFRLWVS